MSSFNCTLAPSAPIAWHQIAGHKKLVLGESWHVTPLPPDSAQGPARALDVARSLNRTSIAVQGCDSTCTVAAAIAASSHAVQEAAGLPAHGEHLDFDAHDWWFRTSFDDDDGADDGGQLVLNGLATLVDVWLNGVWLGRTDNMFMRWEADVSSLLLEHNELVLCARAMTPQLTPRRPRARWRARLLASQEWRWHRTTQLGRMPGFGPATPPVGPWRPVVLERRPALAVRELSVQPGVQGGVPVLDVSAHVGSLIRSAKLSCGPVSQPTHIDQQGGSAVIRATLASTCLELWWPHTHGSPQVYPARLDITLHDNSQVTIDLGDVGFRTGSVDTTDDGFAMSVNGHPLFVRGVCWNARDWTRLDLSDAELDAELRLLVTAGVNAVRLSGCFTYPSHAFLAACDRHGVMVWQDLMFSVLDYPEYDPQFASLCEREVRQVLARMQAHPCLAVVCGNSEVAQQAAMSGIPPAELGHSLFRERLANVSNTVLPNVPYWPSTPWGGPLPFEVAAGTAHYFGVGAYKRDLNDARRSNVRFTTECLAFAHVPEPESLHAAGAGVSRVHGPLWKQRVPRDGGANWDFEDVRDHYVERLFGESAMVLRETDPARYLALGRAASGIVVERTLQEFRRSDSSCNGAFLWLWADPWMGAGWGCIDSDGRPKSAWYALRRASRDVAISLTNEGMSGAHLHAHNDTPHSVSGTIVLRLLRHGAEETVVASRALTVAARSSLTVSCDELIGRFTDIVHAYRFGPPTHDIVHAVWIAGAPDVQSRPADNNFNAATTRYLSRAVIDEAVLLPHGDVCAQDDTGLSVESIRRLDDSNALLMLTCARTTAHVRVGGAGWLADDSYFTLVPGVTRVVRLRRTPRPQEAASVASPDEINVDAASSIRSIRSMVPGLEMAFATALERSKPALNRTAEDFL